MRDSVLPARQVTSSRRVRTGLEVGEVVDVLEADTTRVLSLECQCACACTAF